jgi:hypothetical protein
MDITLFPSPGIMSFGTQIPDQGQHRDCPPTLVGGCGMCNVISRAYRKTCFASTREAIRLLLAFAAIESPLVRREIIRTALNAALPGNMSPNHAANRQLGGVEGVGRALE